MSPAPDATAVVALHGEVDMETADEIAGVVRTALDAGYTRLALDLSQVTFMDSQGLNALIGGRNEVLAAGGSLVSRDPSPAVCRVLELTGLDGIFYER